jgi:hypothetical protein
MIVLQKHKNLYRYAVTPREDTKSQSHIESVPPLINHANERFCISGNHRLVNESGLRRASKKRKSTNNKVHKNVMEYDL